MSNTAFTKVISPATKQIFNIEKVKNNQLPLHFQLTKDVKTILVDGKKVKFMRNVDRTQYVAFTIGEQNYYIRDHSVMDATNLTTYVKPTVERKAGFTKAQLLKLIEEAGIELKK